MWDPSRRGIWCFFFYIDLKDTCFQIPVHPDSWLYIRITLNGRLSSWRHCVLPFQQLPRSSPDCSSWYQSGLTGGSFDCFATWAIGLSYWSHCKLLLRLCQDLEIVISWEKSHLESTNKAQYLEMLINTTQEIARFRDSADKCLCLSACEYVAIDFWPHGPSRMVSSWRQDPNAPLQWQLKAYWAASVDKFSNASPFFWTMPVIVSAGGCKRRGGVPSPSPSASSVSSVHWCVSNWLGSASAGYNWSGDVDVSQEGTSYCRKRWRQFS